MERKAMDKQPHMEGCFVGFKPMMTFSIWPRKIPCHLDLYVIIQIFNPSFSLVFSTLSPFCKFPYHNGLSFAHNVVCFQLIIQLDFHLAFDS